MREPSQEEQKVFSRDGVYVARGLLQPDQVSQARACFEWGVANPGPDAVTVFPGTQHEHYNQIFAPGSWEAGIGAFVRDAGFGDYAAKLWESQHCWYFGDEYFIKSGGTVGNSPWHQDNSVIPSKGAHWVNFWISFESLPAHNSLGFVRGSHLGKLYNGAAYKDPDDPTQLLYPDSDFERLPDIDAELALDPNSWDVLSFEIEPGDVLVCHPCGLHGGAPVDEVTPERHTLALRFFGDDAIYSSLPNTDYYFLDDQTDGVPFRSEHLPQLC